MPLGLAAMRREINVNGRVRGVSVHRVAGRYLVDVDGRTWMVDAARVTSRRLSLLVSERPIVGEGGTELGVSSQGRTFSWDVAIRPVAAFRRLNVSVGPTAVAVSFGALPRSGSDGGSTVSADGPCSVAAPMPGKVVRVLVKPGDRVRAHQAIAVVEAMKMENELRTAREGVVLDVSVRAGQLVEVGTVLAVVGDAS
jgi:biotin carboxyl carrier protein